MSELPQKDPLSKRTDRTSATLHSRGIAPQKLRENSTDAYLFRGIRLSSDTPSDGKIWVYRVGTGQWELEDIGSGSGGVTHSEDHASRHAENGADEILVELLGTTEVDTAKVLKPDGIGGLTFGAASGSGGTLDQAYDSGGVGAGRVVNTHDGAVLLQTTEADVAPNLDLRRAIADVARAILEIGITGEANPRLRALASGQLEWSGSGPVAPDVWLKWAAATVLELGAAGGTSGTLRVDKVEGRTTTPNRFHASEGIFIDQLTGFTVESATISAGLITITNSFVTVLGQGAASDDLDNIGVTAGAVFTGDFLILMAESDTQTITLRHGAGNIKCIGGANILLDDLGDYVICVRNGTTWYALGVAAGLTAGQTERAFSLGIAGNIPVATAQAADFPFPIPHNCTLLRMKAMVKTATSVTKDIQLRRYTGGVWADVAGFSLSLAAGAGLTAPVVVNPADVTGVTEDTPFQLSVTDAVAASGANLDLVVVYAPV